MATEHYFVCKKCRHICKYAYLRNGYIVEPEKLHGFLTRHFFDCGGDFRLESEDSYLDNYSSFHHDDEEPKSKI